jgi:hypothetical protein
MKFSAILALLGLSGTIDMVKATYGVDLSSYASTSAFSCMRSNGYDFAIPRGWCSYGGADGNVMANVNNARAAGIEYVDVYMFPCRGKSATDQVNQFINYMGAPNPNPDGAT